MPIIGRPPKPIEGRFWEKVVKQEDGCWVFTGGKGSSKKNRENSYGHINAKPGEEFAAHRVSWVIHHGPVPEGLQVLHTCDVRRCVNPDHLFLGTHEQNMEDMVSKGRSRKGSKHPVSKLTEVQVVEMRRLYKTGKYSQERLGRMFGCNQTNVGFIVRRVRWKHVE